MKKFFTIAPSILSANFLNLFNELKNIQDYGINWIHFDIMDGNFVPNLTFGPKILRDINLKFPNFHINCHFMVKIINRSIFDYLYPFINFGASSLILHIESLTKEQIKDFLNLKIFFPKIKLGLAIKPDTNVKYIINFLYKIDIILVMSVNPGFSGQVFLPKVINKILIIKNYIKKNNLLTLIQIDGGINNKNFIICKNAGVDIFVMGDFFFNNNNIKKFLLDLDLL